MVSDSYGQSCSRNYLFNKISLYNEQCRRHVNISQFPLFDKFQVLTHQSRGNNDYSYRQNSSLSMREVGDGSENWNDESKDV